MQYPVLRKVPVVVGGCATPASRSQSDRSILKSVKHRNACGTVRAEWRRLTTVCLAVIAYFCRVAMEAILVAVRPVLGWTDSKID